MKQVGILPAPIIEEVSNEGINAVNWFLPILFVSSLSVRTPKVEPNPLDYEITLGIEKKGQFYLNRQWERELGKEYIDEEYWTVFNYKNIQFKDRYVDKRSRGYRYNQMEIKVKKENYAIGYVLRYANKDFQNRILLGWELRKRFNFKIISGQLTVRSEITSDFKVVDRHAYVKAKIGLMQNLSLFLLFQSEKVGSADYLQFKVGIELELPTVKR